MEIEHLISQEEILFVEVLLPLPIPKLFTYRLPSDCNELAMVGKRVFVTFNNKKVYTGLILNITNVAPELYKAEYILGIIDENPLIDLDQIEFWKWISNYYMCSLGQVMAAALPSGLKLESETYVSINQEIEYDETELDEKEVKLLNALKGKEKLKISELEKELKSKSSFLKMIKSLNDRQLVLIFEDIPFAYKAKVSTWIKINENLNDNELETTLNQLEKKAKKQYEALLLLISLPNSRANKLDFQKRNNISSTILKTLEDKNLIKFEKIEIDRIESHHSLNTEYQLNEIQLKAKEEIKSLFKLFTTVLLHGVTSSGKTLVYIELIKEELNKGNTVLLMVPEIALTESLIIQLETYFKENFIVAHSRFSKNEKVEIWNKVKNNEIKLIVGPRSCVFLPFKNLGLVIVDEEHENTYKQSEKAPKFNARDTALVLANKHKAKVLLGSATPSVESYYNAFNGKYGLVEIESTYKGHTKAEIQFADIKEDVRTKKMHGVFTHQLFESLKKIKKENKQAILFQNRKGYVPLVECSVCGWVVQCKNCDISLTYYKHSNNLKCHYCGYTEQNITKCRACGSNNMSIQGYGTERITEELQALLPELTTIRFDHETLQAKNAVKNIINDFENGKIDVLVGTQLVVKGLDFKNVSLSSVINTDQLLMFPDFRAYERTFQLLIQLAGRAGRHQENGKMIIQTKNVEHPLLKLIKDYDFKGFYHQQLKERFQFHYPPYTKLIKVTFKHKLHDECNKAAQWYVNVIKKELKDMVLGPEIPYISMLRNMYIRNILIKIPSESKKVSAIKQYLIKSYEFLINQYQIKGLQIDFDVDPY